MAGETGGPAGALERDPLGEHDRDAARPRPAADGHDRRHPRRRRARLPPRRSRRRGRLSPARRVLPDVHPDDGARRVRHPAGRVARSRRRHHHDLDRGLPRRRPARGHRRDRAGDGPVRRRDRDGPRRGAPAQPHPARRVPLHDQGQAPPTTAATTPRRSTRCSTPPATRSCAPSRPPAGSAATPSSSASASRRSSRSPAGGAFAEDATVEVHPDGTVTVLTGTSPHGQGHATAWAMLASEQLGIPIEKITVKHGDTDLVPRGGGHDGLAQPADRRRRGAPGRGRAGRGGPAARGRRAGGRRSTTSRWPTARCRCAARTSRSRSAELAESRAAADGGEVRLRRPVVPVRRPPGRRRGRRRVRQGGRRPDRHRRRRRARAQPAARRGPAPRRHRPGHRPGAARGGRATTPTATR